MLPISWGLCWGEAVWVWATSPYSHGHTGWLSLSLSLSLSLLEESIVVGVLAVSALTERSALFKSAMTHRTFSWYWSMQSTPSSMAPSSVSSKISWSEGDKTSSFLFKLLINSSRSARFSGSELKAVLACPISLVVDALWPAHTFVFLGKTSSGLEFIHVHVVQISIDYRSDSTWCGSWFDSWFFHTDPVGRTM